MPSKRREPIPADDEYDFDEQESLEVTQDLEDYERNFDEAERGEPIWEDEIDEHNDASAMLLDADDENATSERAEPIMEDDAEGDSTASTAMI